MKLFHALPFVALLANSVLSSGLAPPSYTYAHCSKNGEDWAYLTAEQCKSYGATGIGCNGVCFTDSGRYCTYKDTYAAREGMCKFKEWCEQEGYVAMAKYCSDVLGIPAGCGKDVQITYGFSTQCRGYY